MTILHIDSSIRSQDSISRSLSHQVVERLDGEVIYRDLTIGLDFISEQSFIAAQVPLDERDDSQKKSAELADELIDELKRADTIVMGAPVYNFGPPASLKAWADLVARAGTTFKYTANGPQGLLQNKKAYIVAVSGGTPIGGEIDFMSTWLRFFLGFLGISDVELIVADGTMGSDGVQKVKAAEEAVQKIT